LEAPARLSLCECVAAPGGIQTRDGRVWPRPSLSLAAIQLGFHEQERHFPPKQPCDEIPVRMRARDFNLLSPQLSNSGIPHQFPAECHLIENLDKLHQMQEFKSLPLYNQFSQKGGL
jgi:hypothetical protein